MPKLSLRCVAGVLFACSLLTGQVDRANLTGTVVDPSGAAVPEAQVEVFFASTGLKRIAKTSPSGSKRNTGEYPT